MAVDVKDYCDPNKFRVREDLLLSADLGFYTDF